MFTLGDSNLNHCFVRGLSKLVLSTKYLVFVLFLGFALPVNATHFRGGQIVWSIPDPTGSPLTVQFVVTTSWRSDAYECADLAFGDGTFGTGCTNNPQIGTGIDAAGLAYNTYRYVASHTYALPGDYTASLQGCCRISTLQNGADANYRVGAVLSLGGLNNAGPTASLAPLNTLQIGAIRTIAFPMADNDGDALTCRLATDAEAGFYGAIPITGAAKKPTVMFASGICKITWDVTSAADAGKQYVLPIVVESSRGGKISSLQLDTMVILSATPPPACTGSGAFTVPANAPFSNVFTGIQSGSSLKLTATGAPSGSVFSPTLGSSGTSPFSSNFSWSPPLAAANTSVAFTVTFTDTAILQATCSLALTIGPPALPPNTTVVASNNNPAVYGQSVLFTAWVAGSVGATPSGNVGFCDGGSASDVTFCASGSLLPACGSVTLAGGGISRIATCTSTGLVAGSHQITAGYIGDASSPASRSSSLSQIVAKASQTIAFDSIPVLAVGGAGSVSALIGTPSAGQPIVFTSLTPAVCTVIGQTVNAVMKGICTIAANSVGSANFDAALQVTVDILVAAATQIITFSPLAIAPAVGVSFALNATTSSGLIVTFTALTPSVCSVSGNTAFAISVGTCSIAADQSGNSQFLAATRVVQSTVVSQILPVPILNSLAVALLAFLIAIVGMRARSNWRNW